MRHAVVLLETPRKFVHQLAGHNPLLPLRVSQNSLQLGGGIIHQLARDDKSLHLGGRQFEFDLAKYPLADGHQPARAGLLIARVFGNPPQAFIRKQHFDAISGEILLVLANDAALGVFQDQEQVIHLQAVAHHTHRQPADELRFKAELDEIPRLAVAQHLLGGFQGALLGAQTR